MKIKKAVIPVAGLGTRFLPATKTVPKEMLPIVDKPALLYIMEEIVAADISHVVLIAGRGKSAIEDFFDTSYEVEDTLERAGRTELLKPLHEVVKKLRVVSIRQHVALGLGHAVLCAEPAIGRDPFAVLLGDEIMITGPGRPSGIAQLARIYEETKQSTVAVMEVADRDVSKYGSSRSAKRVPTCGRCTRSSRSRRSGKRPAAWPSPAVMSSRAESSTICARRGPGAGARSS